MRWSDCTWVWNRSSLELEVGRFIPSFIILKPKSARLIEARKGVSNPRWKNLPCKVGGKTIKPDPLIPTKSDGIHIQRAQGKMKFLEVERSCISIGNFGTKGWKWKYISKQLIFLRSVGLKCPSPLTYRQNISKSFHMSSCHVKCWE